VAFRYFCYLIRFRKKKSDQLIKFPKINVIRPYDYFYRHWSEFANVFNVQIIRLFFQISDNNFLAQNVPGYLKCILE